jgi:hypothetical protein
MTTPTTRRLAAALGVFVWSLLLATGISFAERPEPEVHGTFDGDEMYTLLPPDGIPAILDPEYVTGEEAAAQMSAAEHVLGLATGSETTCLKARPSRPPGDLFVIRAWFTSARSKTRY